MILHENSPPADDSHEISCLISYFQKRWQNLKLSSVALLGLINGEEHSFKKLATLYNVPYTVGKSLMSLSTNMSHFVG